jgi:hypothetical protein
MRQGVGQGCYEEVLNGFSGVSKTRTRAQHVHKKTRHELLMIENDIDAG